MWKTILLFTILHFLTLVSYGQNSLNNDLKPMNCESNIVHIKSTFSKVIESFNANDEVIILIANLGNKEKKKALNQRRLHNLRQAILGLGISDKVIITSEGNGVKGYGRVDVYVKGKLLLFLLAEKNRDLCVSCCGPDERFYPTKN